jgi:two-component system response regulator FixJ
VEVHRASIMIKLKVSNFADVLRVAFAAGLGYEDDWCEAHYSGNEPREVWAQKPTQ